MSLIAAAAELAGVTVEEALAALEGLDPAMLGPEEEQVLAELAMIEDRDPHLAYLSNPTGPGRWAIAPWARMVYEDPHPMKAVIGCNRGGKTILIAALLVAVALNRHPHIRHRNGLPGSSIVVVPNLDRSYARDYSVAMRKMIPAGSLSPRCKFWSDRGYRVGIAPQISWANGHVTQAVGSTQRGGAIAGGEGVLLVVFNEPMPISIFDEVMRQTTQVDGTGVPTDVLLITTPWDNEIPLEEHYQRIRGPDGEEPESWDKPVLQPTGWKEYRIPLLEETVPHRTRESIADQKRKTSKAQWPQRIEAKWFGPAKNRALGSWDGSQVFSMPRRRLEELPGLRDEDELAIRVSFDHGEGAGKEVILFGAHTTDVETRRGWIFAHHLNREGGTVEDDCQAVVAILRLWGLRPNEIRVWVGDVNAKLNDVYTRALRRAFKAAGWAWSGSLVKADKSPGSIDYGLTVLDDALGREACGVPALQVNEECAPVVVAMERHENKGKHEKTKDVMDSVRYLFAEALDVQAPGLSLAEANPKEEARARSVFSAQRGREIDKEWMPGGF